ncbi:hypothetical protein BD626DRAFT_514020, partial [Schizophyllum amplum]
DENITCVRKKKPTQPAATCGPNARGQSSAARVAPGWFQVSARWSVSILFPGQII